MVALQREAKLTRERLRVFVVLNFSRRSAENYHAGTGGGWISRRGVSRSVFTGMVEWARLPISRCDGKEVWSRGKVLCMLRIAREMSSDYLISGRDNLLLPCHCCGTSRGNYGCVRNLMCWQIACRDVTCDRGAFWTIIREATKWNAVYGKVDCGVVNQRGRLGVGELVQYVEIAVVVNCDKIVRVFEPSIWG